MNDDGMGEWNWKFLELFRPGPSQSSLLKTKRDADALREKQQKPVNQRRAAVMATRAKQDK